MAVSRRTLQLSLLLTLTGVVLAAGLFRWLQHAKSAQPCSEGEHIDMSDCECLQPLVAVDGLCTRMADAANQTGPCAKNGDCPAGMACISGDCLPPPTPVAAATPPPRLKLDLTPWQVGHIWRYRYQETPANPEREDLVRDDVVERTLDTMEPDGLGGFQIRLTQRGGISKQTDSTTIRETISPEGIGDALLTAPPQSATWHGPDQGEQQVWVLKSPGREFWIHPKLGKVRETFAAADGKQISLELTGWAFGGNQGGDMTTPIRWCQWTDNGGGKDGWLAQTGQSSKLRLGNPRHGYSGVTAVRDDIDGSSLLIEGSGPSRTVTEADASLLIAKVWDDPVGKVEWLVGIWRSPAAGTVVTMTRLGEDGVQTFRERLSYQSVLRETDDHYLYLLKRGHDCVVGAGYAPDKSRRFLALFRLLPEQTPTREGGSWN